MLKSPFDYPRLFPSADQTIWSIGRALRCERTTCVRILKRCLGQVDEWESKVHAWVLLDRDQAIEQARKLDDELKARNYRGALHGIPIGIKDIIDVAGMPTACGSKLWADRTAGKDAKVVADLREAGAVILGKTVTTPYAWIDPPVTRNPWNLERTPGGSSSGSAAAVACGMCFGAIGSQTGGSITRPASFCGIAGMKPDNQLLNDGVRPLAPSFDQVGPMARTVDDLSLMLQAMQGTRPDNNARAALAKPPRLARFRGFFDRRADPAASHSLNVAAQILAGAGAAIIEIDDPIDFEEILRDHRLVMAAEAAKIHSSWLEEYAADYPARIRALVLEGQSVEATQYERAREGSKKKMASYLEARAKHEFHAVITPATIGTAPDPSTTGDPAFNSPWSYLRFPTVSCPIGVAADGLPLAIQIVECRGRDVELLQIARWCEQAIGSSRQ
jgi:aspartyl-tRNA(Asn)/glutamyl-tRNA(Gln) amidotransferase subunit A